MARQNNSAANQRLRILAHLLAHNRLTTITAREELDVMMPAARIHELRHRFGYLGRIVTHETWETNAQGNRHRVAVYVLLSDGMEAVQ